jgi:hypothetical protein
VISGLNALIMQHRDNYFVLYLHRYKETGLTRSCFFLVYMFLYLINPCLFKWPSGFWTVYYFHVFQPIRYMVRDKMDHTSNLSNLGFMNCQTKVVILDLNCDFRLIKKTLWSQNKVIRHFLGKNIVFCVNHATSRQLFCTLFTSL